MSEKWIFILTLISLSSCEEMTLLTKLRTGFLKNYKGYTSAVMMHFDMPEDVKTASFQFSAAKMSSSCDAKDIVIDMKIDSPPVINPDNSNFPENYLTNGRPELYHLEFLSSETYQYLNVTSPKAGSYYAVAFHPYVNPKDEGILQEGLFADCRTYLRVSVYIDKDENIIPIIPNTEAKVTLTPSSQHQFKISVPENVTHILVNFKDITFLNNSNMLITNLYSPSKNQENFNILKSHNKKHATAKFKAMENLNYYLQFSIDTKDESIIKFTFEIKFTYPSNYTRNINISKKNTYQACDNTNFPCNQYNLYKNLSVESFRFLYELEESSNLKSPTAIDLTSEELSVLKFNVRDIVDIGGTIEARLAFNPSDVSHKIIACVHNSEIELPEWENQCKSLESTVLAPIVLNSTNSNRSVAIPFPESGNWYFSFKLFCGNCETCRCPSSCKDEISNCKDLCGQTCDGNQCLECAKQCKADIIEKSQCKDCDCDGSCKRVDEQCSSSVSFYINSYPCVEKGCGSNGRCNLMATQGFIYTSCYCSHNYRGWDCLDDANANSIDTIVLELVLLVMSNMMFLPAVYIAYKRRYYAEMTVYFFTYLSSSVYHGCDAGENIISYCPVEMGILQFCDFYCALLAIWVSILALAHLPKPYTPILHMCGAVLIGFGTTLDKTSMAVFVVPVVIGLVIMLASWFYKYYKTKVIFPSKRYLKINLPCGLVVVIVALLMFTVLQTQSNYKYVHSLWHMLMAIAIIILLPNLKTFLPNESYRL